MFYMKYVFLHEMIAIDGPARVLCALCALCASSVGLTEMDFMNVFGRFTPSKAFRTVQAQAHGQAVVEFPSAAIDISNRHLHEAKV